MLTLKLHGGFRAWDSQNKEIAVKSRKAKALLAYLASPLGKPRSRESIMALLWSNRSEEQARGSLRQALRGLRRDLGEETATALIVSNDEITLDPDYVSVLEAASGDEFLEGLHINDPAFDEWLRDERLRSDEGGAAVTDQRPHAPRNTPSIAVLPFANRSSDPEQQYFADGIAEDITTELSRFGSITVLARHSMFVLRDQAENIRDELESLGADYLLEGSVRRAGDHIRLTAKLVDAPSGQQAWAHRYDRNLADVFSIQDELVHTIVATLIGRVEVSGHERAARKPPDSLAAYDYYLKGMWCDRKHDPAYIDDGITALKKATSLDPGFARAYGLLATFMMEAEWHKGASGAATDACLTMAKKAVDLDPTDGDCFAKLGIVHLDRNEHEEAGRNLEKALSLNPHEPSTWSHYAWYLVSIGEPEKALEYLDRREAIDPYPPNWTADIRAEALYDLKRYEEAAEILEQQQKGNPYSYTHGELAACYGQLGRKDQARASWARYLETAPDASISSVGEGVRYANRANADHWSDGLRKAGLGDG